jgi:hypothetical protein
MAYAATPAIIKNIDLIKDFLQNHAIRWIRQHLQSSQPLILFGISFKNDASTVYAATLAIITDIDLIKNNAFMAYAATPAIINNIDLIKDILENHAIR